MKIAINYMEKSKENAGAVQTELTAEQKLMKETAKKIEDILMGSGLAIQPFIDFSEHAIRPNVRLVARPKETAPAEVAAQIKES